LPAGAQIARRALRRRELQREGYEAVGHGQKSWKGVAMLARDALPALKLNDKQRRDLVEIVEDRYARRSTIITSQIPLDRWYNMIGNAIIADAILDRLVQNAYRIELSGESLRKQCAAPMSDTTVA
jgi:hypothetical protein